MKPCVCTIHSSTRLDCCLLIYGIRGVPQNCPPGLFAHLVHRLTHTQTAFKLQYPSNYNAQGLACDCMFLVCLLWSPHAMHCVSTVSVECQWMNQFPVEHNVLHRLRFHWSFNSRHLSVLPLQAYFHKEKEFECVPRSHSCTRHTSKWECTIDSVVFI